MSQSDHNTTHDPLMPGQIVTIAGERWVVDAWHSHDDERSVFLSLLGNKYVVARWGYTDLQGMVQ